jgi:hypothetical protein
MSDSSEQFVDLDYFARVTTALRKQFLSLWREIDPYPEHLPFEESYCIRDAFARALGWTTETPEYREMKSHVMTREVPAMCERFGARYVIGPLTVYKGRRYIFIIQPDLDCNEAHAEFTDKAPFFAELLELYGWVCYAVIEFDFQQAEG